MDMNKLIEKLEKLKERGINQVEVLKDDEEYLFTLVVAADNKRVFLEINENTKK